MTARIAAPIVTAAGGLAAAVRARPLTAVGAAAAVVALDALLPPLVLAVVRGPWTYFTFNPWLKQLPRFVASDTPLPDKIGFLSRLAWFWFTADGPYGFPEWGFAVDTMDIIRFLILGALIGVYFTLVLHVRTSAAAPWRLPAQRGAGALGAVASVLGLSTGPCSVVGCGAPVLPVVGLVFAGLSSGTLALLSAISRATTGVVAAALAVSIAYLAYRAGSAPAAPSRSERSSA